MDLTHIRASSSTVSCDAIQLLCSLEGGSPDKPLAMFTYVYYTARIMLLMTRRNHVEVIKFPCRFCD